MQDPTLRRDELIRFLGESRTVRRRALAAGAAGIAIGLLLGLVGLGRPAMIVILGTAIVCGVSLWITWGHITDFRRQLDDLDRRAPLARPSRAHARNRS